MLSAETNFTSQRLDNPIPIREQVWPERTVPVVSIWCITYNHANFIRDAIEGFLMQKTTFPVEVFIHDDASTDGTSEIIQEYVNKHPNLFWIVHQKENQWSKGNQKFLLKYLLQQRGDFIALCEGDDYWTDEFKIAKQIEFLKKNPNFSAVFHCGYAVDKNKNRIGFVWDNLTYNSFYSQKECIFSLLSGYPTSALIFRKNVFPEILNDLPNFYKEYPCDYCLDILITENGFLGYLDFEGSAYRQHAGGIWSSLTQIQMHKQKVDRFAALWRCKGLVRKHPDLRSKLLRLMDVQWWLYFESEKQTWVSATLKILSEQRRCGLFLCLEWMFRSKSPARFKLRDCIFGYRKK
jgi:glycosyltransferase involved in cell wall biosynthesis